MQGDRLHPETLKTLRDLVKLHGAAKLIAAIREMDEKLAADAYHTYGAVNRKE